MLLRTGLRSLVTHQRLKMSSFSLIHKSFGDPNEVLELAETKLDISGQNLGANHVLVKFVASPINPADINTVQGSYAIKPLLPAVGGGEGVAEVMAVGSEVKKLSPGDWVYPASAGFGSWQTHAISPESFFMKIDSTGLEAQSAAQLKVNPCTAYRMLKDFVELDQGQCVIQNGANSAVGLNVIQLSKIWQFKTINVVRKRADETEQLKLKKSLTDLGADIVITEEDLRDRDKMAEVFKSVPKPKLALNCVGGKNATDCMRHLDEKGVMVTYGGMSRQPLVIPTGSLIFRDQRFVGFWMTRWYLPRNAESPDWLEMNDEIVGHMKSGKLKSPKAIEFKLEQFKEAIALATSGNFVEGKPMFVFDK